jgi:hypothetical protein
MTPTSHGGSSAPPSTDVPTSHSGSAHSDAPTSTIPVYAPDFGQQSFPGTGSAAPAGASHAQSTPAAAGAPRRTTRPRGPRRAQLQLRHINPWTVLKFTCVLAIALFFVWLIVVGVLYGVLDAAGVVDKINNTVTTINGNGSKPVTAGVVFGGAAIIGVINMILFIALATVGSVVYNLCADLVGGIEITLAES